MTALGCPACGVPCVTVWSKLALGPARSVGCKTCGCRVGVSWLPYAALSVVGTIVPCVLATIVTIALSRTLGALPFGLLTAMFVLALALCSLPFLWAHARLVPLVARA